MAEDELTQDEVDNITQGSKYLTTAKGYKSKFDVVDILTNGNIPEFGNTADKMVCSIELGQLIRKTGFGNGIDNLIKFLAAVDLPHRVMLVRQWPLHLMEQSAREDKLKPLIMEVFKLYPFDK